ncbi:thiosulfate sulfurtransferase [Enterovibrio norvegicus]|uniref:thiosulfate sulfurtransferase GlpE n=1 Tax=Enterovibrio norvegicus TaxID=188144 RepID=UPI0002F594C0|nr:thiosulfate sulfurtransferase GlpE [Enterovibrio norvegicus]OEE45608.1 thiosulfate sulfurtransferase [Enterovibrio norvegicus]OEE62651.1 thiosulfate sulfurtransferase [Enterovibrio norvegicus]
MEQFAHISVTDAWEKIQQDDQTAVIVDIRDPQSFQLSHPQGAFHLTNDSIVQFTQAIDYEQPLLVMCYHGVSSQGAAQYLINQGFEEVYSVDGGFEAWHRQDLPVESGVSSFNQ